MQPQDKVHNYATLQCIIIPLHPPLPDYNTELDLNLIMNRSPRK